MDDYKVPQSVTTNPILVWSTLVTAIGPYRMSFDPNGQKVKGQGHQSYTYATDMATATSSPVCDHYVMHVSSTILSKIGQY